MSTPTMPKTNGTTRITINHLQTKIAKMMPNGTKRITINQPQTKIAKMLLTGAGTLPATNSNSSYAG